MRASLLDRSALNLLQDLLHLRKRVKDHERLVARPDTEHRPSVATQDFLRNPLDQPGVIEVVFQLSLPGVRETFSRRELQPTPDGDLVVTGAKLLAMVTADQPDVSEQPGDSVDPADVNVLMPRDVSHAVLLDRKSSWSRPRGTWPDDESQQPADAHAPSGSGGGGSARSRIDCAWPPLPCTSSQLPAGKHVRHRRGGRLWSVDDRLHHRRRGHRRRDLCRRSQYVAIANRANPTLPSTHLRIPGGRCDRCGRLCCFFPHS